MNVLLIYVVTENINVPVLPLGMAFIATSAEKAGHDIRQVSLTASQAQSDLEEVFEKFQPGAIGISLRNVDDQRRKAEDLLAVHLLSLECG